MGHQNKYFSLMLYFPLVIFLNPVYYQYTHSRCIATLVNKYCAGSRRATKCECKTVITTEERILPSTGTITNQSLQLKSEYVLYRIKKCSQENILEKNICFGVTCNLP